MKNHYYYSPVAFTLLFFLLLVQCIPLKAQSYGWQQLGKGTAGIMPGVRALTICDTISYQPELYAGGTFDTAGGIATRHIAMWNGYTWFSIGKGTDGEVDALCMFKSKLYAGGKFDTAGGKYASRIACWDTTDKWDSLLGGVNANVYALCVYHNALYVGGDFTMANGIKVNRIAKWDGTKWDSVGAGFDSNTVYALAVYNDTLYAGGSFTKSAGQIINYIAKWNGTKWTPVNGGMNNIVYALDSCNTGYYSNKARLYAGGAFTMAGGLNVSHIAMWQNVTGGWDSVGSGTNDTVRAIGEGYGTFGLMAKHTHLDVQFFLMVGGNFIKQGSVYSPNIAFWDGQYWDSVGYVNKPVYAVAATGFSPGPSANYIGGDFDSNYCNFYQCNTANPTNYVAEISILLGGGINEASNNSNISIYPNPSNGKFAVSIRNYQLGIRDQVEIYNTLGERIYFDSFNTQNSTFSIDISSQPPGLYLCRVIDSKGIVVGSQKIIIQ